jgi:type I restriction enzyme M protein
MLSLSEVKNDDNIFNPFAGLASFGVYLKNNQHYYGQEINRKTWALGLLRLMAHNRLDHSDFVAADSVMNWPDGSKKFDLIISNPPIGLRLGEQYRQVLSDFKTPELFYLEKGIELLSTNGKLIAVLPQRFLHSGFAEERVKKMLIDLDLIETIVSLPGGLLLNTGLSLCIVVLSRNKQTPGKIKLVDGKTFMINIGPRKKILNDSELLIAINSPNPDNGIVRSVSNQDIKDNDYNLSVARYFRKKVEGIKLSEILTPIPIQRGNLPENGKLIRIRHLKDDKVDYSLDTSVVEKSELGRMNTQVITESCLLIALRWKTL